MKITFYFALTPKRRGYRAWLFSGVLRLIEGKNYNHIFGVLEDNSASQSCWNIFSWGKPWQKYASQNVIDSYDIEKTAEVELSSSEFEIIQETLKSLEGRRYAVGRLLLIPLYRLTGWNFLTSLPGVTCTNGIARALCAANLWDDPCAPEMAGLNEVERVVDNLRFSRIN